MELKFLELQLDAVPANLTADGDWEHRLSDVVRKRYPQAQLLRWAITAVQNNHTDRLRFVQVEVVATVPTC
ncbi:MAG: hypothetical protein AB4040_15145 [Synechococcus sp.]